MNRNTFKGLRKTSAKLTVINYKILSARTFRVNRGVKIDFPAARLNMIAITNLILTRAIKNWKMFTEILREIFSNFKKIEKMNRQGLISIFLF